MTPTNGIPPDTLTEQTVKSELSELASRTRTFDIVATTVALGALGLGAVSTIPAGPLAFLVGSAVGAAVALGARAYVRSKKEQLQKEISSLQESNEISDRKAEELTAKVEQLYTDNPEKQKVVSC